MNRGFHWQRIVIAVLVGCALTAAGMTILQPRFKAFQTWPAKYSFSPESWLQFKKTAKAEASQSEVAQALLCRSLGF